MYVIKKKIIIIKFMKLNKSKSLTNINPSYAKLETALLIKSTAGDQSLDAWIYIIKKIFYDTK